jgi:Zn-dependent protease
MTFSAVFLVPSLILAPSPWWWLFVMLATFNAVMAIFNLIPFGILDGFKIYSWNKKFWAVAFAASIALAVSAYWLAAPYLGY